MKVEDLINKAITNNDYSIIASIRDKIDLKIEIRNKAAQKLIDKILFYDKIGRKDIAKKRAEALLRLLNS